MPFKNNVAYCDPGLSSDETAGYSVGSQWANAESGVLWVCYVTTKGDAKWAPQNVGYDWPAGAYKLPEYITQVSDGQPAANTGYFLPLLISRKTTIDKAAVALVTAQAGAKCRLALYTGTNGAPAFLRKDFGELDLSSGSGIKELSTGIALQPGLWFLASLFNSPATQPTVKRVSGAVMGAICGGGSDITTGMAGRYYSAAITYGAFPNYAPDVVMAMGTEGAAAFLRRQ